MNELAGIIPPIVTPLTPDGQVDEVSLAALVEHLLSHGVNGLFALGSSAEVSFLRDADRDTVLGTVIAANEGRVPVLAGCIDTGARRVLDHVLRAADLGAEYAVVTAPFYAITSPTDIENHFRWIASHSPIPVVAYDIPVCVGVKLDPEMLVRLGVDGVIAGVKDSSGQGGEFRRLIRHNRAAGEPLRIFSGTEVVADADLLIGAHGIVPGLGNIAPEGYVRIWELAQEGDWEGARREQDRLEALFDVIRAEPSYIGPSGALGAFKAGLVHRGVIQGSVTSAPLRELTPRALEIINALVDDWRDGATAIAPS